MGNTNSSETGTFIGTFTQGFIQGYNNSKTYSHSDSSSDDSSNNDSSNDDNIHHSKYIYILKLEHNKYYIGKTTNPDVRIDNHFSNNGSAWTKKYNPIKVIDVIPGDDFDEDKYTLKYMSKYGVDNVRGGSYCEITLKNDALNQINHMIMSCKDLCFHCGSNTHYANKCPNKTTNKKICDRCGYSNHTIDKCYAKTDVHGKKLFK